MICQFVGKLTLKARKTIMVHIFKTSVKNKTQIKILKPHLDLNFKDIKWNFDLEDCDKILRIESKKNVCQKIICLLNYYHFDCIELE